MVRRAVRLSRQLAARRPLVRPARQRARHGQGRGHGRELQLGRRPAAEHSVVRHGHLRSASARLDHAVRGHRARTSAAPSRRWPSRRSSIICAGSASRRSSCCRSTPSCRTAICCRRACATTGVTTRSVSSRSSRAICRRTPRNEMRVAVRRLHAAGIEVILDVVYNHTAEGSELGPTLSFRGLDNSSYYRLVPDNRAPLHQRHRHRQHAQPVECARAADGDGFAALLGHAVPRRRLPLRPRRDARARAARFRSRRRLLRRAAPGSRFCRASS